MQHDLDRSYERLNRAEEYKRSALGYGLTGQGRALTREYQSQLAHRIGIARVTTRRDKVLWRALKGIDDETLALRLLTAGISVCGSDDLGIDKDGEKNFRDIALWIGRNLGHRGKIGCKVGAWGIDLLLTLPCFALDDEGILRPTARAIDFADDVLAEAVKNNALLSPLLEPPRPWTQVSKGALPPDHWAKVALIRGHRASQAAARKAISDGRMQKVLDAINALQAVPFTINRPILDFLCRAGPKPELSDGELKVWDTDIVTAVAMACSDRFYVPLNMDFRGRIYPIPHFNFTRADPVRALFLLAEGEPIGESGLLWLKAHVAARADGNKWSPVEKPSALNLVNRVAWTNDNLETLRNIGEAVLRGDDPANLAWALSKDPYQFLAACVELVQALDAGPNFITRLPLTFDASCSGLQHLCAMTRADEGRYVNLVATNDEADDFYARVAFETYRANPEIQELMRNNPFNRAIVKQPAMSYFYGSRPGGFAKNSAGHWRPYGMTKQVVDALGSKKGAKELAHAINRAIEGMVPKAAAVLHYLRQLAGICAEHELPLRWETPLGLPVINRYHDPETERIAVVVKGRRRDVKLTVGDKKRKSRRIGPRTRLRQISYTPSTPVTFK